MTNFFLLLFHLVPIYSKVLRFVLSSIEGSRYCSPNKNTRNNNKKVREGGGERLGDNNKKLHVYILWSVLLRIEIMKHKIRLLVYRGSRFCYFAH